MLRAARGLAPSSKRRPLAGAAGQRENVAVELWLDANGANLSARSLEHSRRDGRDGCILEQACARAGVVPLENLQLLGFGGIRYANLHQEAIELRLGQRIGAFEVDGVLRRKHGEPTGQRTSCAVTRDLALFHALEQRGLGARRHAVDFVDEKQVSEHGTGVKGERVGTGTKNRGAEDVGGHQVGSGLHALKAEPEQTAERLHHQRLGDAGNALKQRVALAQDGNQHLFDGLRLPGDHAAQFSARVGDELTCCLKSRLLPHYLCFLSVPRS